ncbi:hypothetical protein pdam_00021408 [Pocillopora damicornis]|uniref:EGF-like domain-containing protein n=1 Tax=Pocillopora damicornis TaxID=46731 RepID=A0A3M6UX18_POCDA|nr:hypothetical protein pdam_00021408 [Pocillopora damicornis]
MNSGNNGGPPPGAVGGFGGGGGGSEDNDASGGGGGYSGGGSGNSWNQAGGGGGSYCNGEDCSGLTDSDECNAIVSVCDVNADCKNTLGSYYCFCRAGFSGDGHTCKGGKKFYQETYSFHTAMYCESQNRWKRRTLWNYTDVHWSTRYLIKAWGARGGTHSYDYGDNPGTYYGGKGAFREGKFRLNKGTVLNIVDKCELSKRTKEARPEDFVTNSERYYFRRDTKRAILGAIPELSADSCKEIKASEGGEAILMNVPVVYMIATFQRHALTLLDRLAAHVTIRTKGMEDPAVISHQSLTGGDRKVTYDNQDTVCDNGLTGWYRFEGAAGTRMPTSCPPTHRCNSHVPGWINGTHPTQADGQVTRTVCFHWQSDCCYKSSAVKVINCGGYYVYFINGTPWCHLRYCGTD